MSSPEKSSNGLSYSAVLKMSFKKSKNSNNKSCAKFQNITRYVEKALSKSQIQSGFINVNAMDTASSVFINDHESGLHKDFQLFLDKWVPSDKNTNYQFDNAAAHIKRQLFGRGVMIAVTDGKLHFGPWEQIFYGEFENNPDKEQEVLIKIIGV